MGTNIDAPKARDYGSETRDTLQAQVDLAPQLYAAEAKFAPLYQNLQLGLAQQAAPQMMSMYEKDIVPVLSRIQSQSQQDQRQADVNAVRDLGPQAMEAMRASNPQQAQLMDALQKDAMSGMAAGSALTPQQMAQTQQASRAAWGARGLASSPAAASSEVIAQQLAGNAEQDRRRAMAGSMVSANQSVYGDPFAQILGRSSGVAGMAGGFGAQAQGFNPGRLFNPESQYAADIMGSNSQQQLATNTAEAANRSALFSSMISSVGNAASSM
jgi:hypothetical protein